MAKQKRWGKVHVDTRDWKVYNEELVQRGEFYVNPRFLETWLVEVKDLNEWKVGQPYVYPPSMIEFLAVLHARGFDYRSLEGIMRAFARRIAPFPVISFSQIRRRVLALNLTFSLKADNLVVGGDGTGLKMTNRGEYRTEKYADHRGWIKVVILGDVKGNIVDIIVGNDDLNEPQAVRDMVQEHHEHIDKCLLDGLHDINETFDLCDKHDITPVINIRSNASPAGLGARPRAVREYQSQSYQEWARKHGYGFRWPATEGIFSAEKRMFGEELTSHTKENMHREAKLKFWAYQAVRNHATN
jgi:hypothetical protein